VDKANLKPTGSNPYMTLNPGAVCTLTADDARLTVTILDQTEVVDGVTTRVLEEREEVRGQLKEVSRNFFAIDPATGDIYYFGEDVDNYKDGKIESHESAWRSGVDGARFGLFLPGRPRVGDRFYQEIAPGIALDRVEITSVDHHIATPAAAFDDCVRIEETTPLERGRSHKVYAPGVGMVMDDEFLLASHSRR
jgi:hypothetical protein